MSRQYLYEFPWQGPSLTLAQPSGAVASLGPGDMPMGLMVSRSEGIVMMVLQYPSGGQEPIRWLDQIGRIKLGVGMHSWRLMAIALNTAGLDPNDLSGLQHELQHALFDLRHQAQWAGPQLNYAAAERALGLEGVEAGFVRPPPVWLTAAVEAMRSSDPPSLGKARR